MNLRLSENIRLFRSARDLTQSDLATLLSVTPQAVSRWENGQAYPDVELLPLLARHLGTSIDTLMGVEKQTAKHLERELFERLREKPESAAMREQNERRILEILAALAEKSSFPFYLRKYFHHLMTPECRANLPRAVWENYAENARHMIRERIRVSPFSESVDLLYAAVAMEDEDRLDEWAKLCTLPEYVRESLFDGMLLSRYTRKEDAERLNMQAQRILFREIKNSIFYLTRIASDKLLEQSETLRDPDCYRLALDTLALYSSRVDDIFLLTRITAETEYAKALLLSGKREESLDMIATATEHIGVLRDLPSGTVLRGSVSALDTVETVLKRDVEFERSILDLGGYHHHRVFDPIREEPRYLAYQEALCAFFPKDPDVRGWVNEDGALPLAPEWETLLRRAKEIAATLSKDEQVVVIRTTRGDVDAITQTFDAAITPDSAIKALVRIKRQYGASIEKLVCVFHGGHLDLPSMAFREALVEVDPAHYSAEMLLNGLRGYIAKTVEVTMPKGHRERQ